MRLVYTLLQIVEGMPAERRNALVYIIVDWEAGEATASLRYSQSPRDELHTLATHVSMDEQIRELAASGLVGRIDAARLVGGAEAVQAGYSPVAWNIVPWYGRRLPPPPDVYWREAKGT